MDFYKIIQKPIKNGVMEIYADYSVRSFNDLMVRGHSFYAVWDEELGLWTTDEMEVARLVDKSLNEYYEKEKSTLSGVTHIKYLNQYSNGAWSAFKRYIKDLPDRYHTLDMKLAFSNTDVKKTDYISRRLDYPLEKGDCSSYNKLMSTLYDKDERQKLEWAIGAIISGDAKKIQKFIVLYGSAGAGKSTFLNIVQKLFKGYYTTFDAKELTSATNSFATDAFGNDPLVAIQHDGDLSRISDNSKLNSIVSHEEIIVNEKFKTKYTTKAKCFLFMGTNKPIKITDAKSGLIRRLIDVTPSGRKLPRKEYEDLYSRVDFELGAIAYHCLDVYNKLGRGYYDNYRPLDMMYKTDPFFNFVEYYYDAFKDQDEITLRQAYTMYKEYCDEASETNVMRMFQFREELKNYFETYTERSHEKRNFFTGFKASVFDKQKQEIDNPDGSKITMDCESSLLDLYLENMPAQYATASETPKCAWADVTTTLKDIDTDRIHYVKVPENMIVIDFDLKDSSGKKSKKRNLEAASKWPETYAELSKGGAGIHLHYLYSGDVTELSRVYDDNIEIKVFTGNSALRRRLTKCNNKPIATLSSGLPLKEKKEMVNFDTLRSEKSLRKMITRNLNKEIHNATKPSIDFIVKILDDAYGSGLKYDISDMQSSIIAFAANSSNNADYCLKMVDKMKFKGKEEDAWVGPEEDKPIVFYDVEVFPNLFLVNWKIKGDEHKVVRMINPKPYEVENLMRMKIVGFNCRRYDNHILYAAMMGYSNQELFNLSQKIIDNRKGALFMEAYNASYTDIYDYCAKKQSLKKWEIELGIHHQELGLPWDKPVPEEQWIKVAEYCDNDVIATEALRNATQGDFKAREILAAIAGGSVNDTTNSLTTRLIFGNNRKPKLVYTDLKTGEQS